MPRRVAYIDHATETGGAQKSLTELMARLDPERYEPALVHSRGADWAGAAELAQMRHIAAFAPSELFGVRREDVRPGRLRALGHAWSLTGPARAAARAVRETGAALIHTNSPKSHIIGGLASRLTRRPLVWHVRDIMEGHALKVMLRMAGLVKPSIIAISQAVADQFAGSCAAVTVIHNGVPLARFTPGPASEALRAELGLPPRTPVVVTVGRLTPWKGHRTLLAAFAALHAHEPAAVLIVAGSAAFWEPAYADDLRRYAQELGVGESVRWLGDRSDVPDLLRLADVFCLPSVNEPFGRAIVEAMATAKPVVACRSGGVPEVVADGQTGLLVPDDAPAELAAALGDLLRDPQRAQAMGEAGSRRARELFDAERVALEVQGLYDRLLAR
jgi:glycosyltransferase involved in cell wall biosynthesis